MVGIGGVFFRAKDPEALRAWYAEHPGIRRGREAKRAPASMSTHFLFELWQPPAG